MRRGQQHLSPLQGTGHPTAQILHPAGSGRNGQRRLSRRAVGPRKNATAEIQGSGYRLDKYSVFI